MRAIYLKTRIFLLTAIQWSFGAFNLQLRRLTKGTDLEDPDKEIRRLAGPDVRWIMEFGAADGRDSKVLAAEYPNAKVLALEPVPGSFEKLALAAKNESRIIAREMAVSDKPGTQTLFLASERDASALSAPNQTGSAFDKHAENVGKVDVAVTTIDEQCAELGIEHIDILKMDAQGAELLALHGAESTLKRGAIGVIYTEIQFIKLYEQSCLFHELWHHLDGAGYALHNIYNLNHNEHGQLCWGDAIFVKRPT